MQIYFKKCTLVLKPEGNVFCLQNSCLPHQHIEIARAHLTFFKWFWHQGLLWKGHRKSHAVGWPWWFYLSWSSTVPNLFILMYFHPIEWYPFTHLTKKETMGTILTPLSPHWPLISPVILTPPSSAICLLPLVQDTKISYLDDNSGFLNDLPHANLNLKSDK